MRYRNLMHLSTLLTLAMVLLLAGCGTDRTSVTSSSDASGTSEFQYPKITPDDLAKGPVPGFRFFNASATPNIDFSECAEISTSRWCGPTTNRTIGFAFMVSVRITPGDMPSSNWITVTLPLGECFAVADFYPHPYLFNGTVELVWDLNGFDLPRDFDYTTLIPFYVNDAGEYEQMPFTWDGSHQILTVYTNHCSRYIIGQKITSSAGE
jgi:hypothetical protein